ncbi:TPA: hypothetical protein ACGUM0_003941 [Vibrio vulnificus]
MKAEKKRDGVSFDGMASVKKLLTTLGVALAHGDDELAHDVNLELDTLITQYKKATPPAVGIENVIKKREQIMAGLVTEKKQTVTKTIEKEVSMHIKDKKKAKKVAKSVTNIAKSLAGKIRDEKKDAALVEQMLAESGIQVRGQQKVIHLPHGYCQ